MLANPFIPARKERIYLRMALVGASGSGKTYTALTIASQLAALRGGKLAVIDTEGRSARKYADKFNFDVLDLSNNYSPAKYIEAMNAAVQHGYAVVLIDSFTHAWNGAGGVLEVVDKTGQKMGNNDWAGWSKGRPLQNSLHEAVLTLPIDIIGTMRSKTEWAQQINPKTGKNEPVKVGLAPVQSADFEYEFDVVAYMDMQHTVTITKTRCSPLDGLERAPDETFLSGTLYGWLTDGTMPDNPARLVKNYLATESGQDTFRDFLQKLNITDNKPYLAALGNLNRYTEYDGLYDDLCKEVQTIHDKLNTPPEPPEDDTPADEPQVDPASTSDPAPEVTPPPAGFVIVNEAIALNGNVEFNAPGVGILSVNRHRLMTMLEAGDVNEKINGKRQVEAMGIHQWNPGSTGDMTTHSFPPIRLFFKTVNATIGGIKLTVHDATPETEWRNKLPEAIKPDLDAETNAARELEDDKEPEGAN